MKLSACTEWLFFHLWKTNPKTQKSCDGIIIPETIIYRYLGKYERWSWPYFWYFTNKQGDIVRKTKDGIQIDDLFKAFSQGPNKKEIIATFLSSTNIHDNTQELIEFEHFTQSDFEIFLRQTDKKLSSILQKFVQPCLNRNQMIKVVWTPSFCIFTKNQNVNSIKNNQIPLNDRVSTFEGSEQNNQEEPIKSLTLQKDIENICINIVKHIQEVSGGNIQIARMVLYLKQDYNNSIQLLFSTDIKIRKKNSVEVSQIQESENVNKRSESPIFKIVRKEEKQSSFHQMQEQNNIGQYQPYNGKHCIYCKQMSNLYNISFNNIIESFDKNIMNNEHFLKVNPFDQHNVNKKPNFCITLQQNDIDYKLPFLNDNYENNQEDKKFPLFLQYIWGNMTNQQYLIYKKNICWRQLETKVCQQCFMDFTLYQTLNDFSLNKKPTSPPKFQISTNLKKSPERIDSIQQINQEKQQIQNNALIRLKSITKNKKNENLTTCLNDVQKRAMSNKTQNYFFNNSINHQMKTFKDLNVCDKLTITDKQLQIQQKLGIKERIQTSNNYIKRNFNIKKPEQQIWSSKTMTSVQQGLKIQKYNPSKKYLNKNQTLNNIHVYKKDRANTSFCSQSTLDVSKSKITHTKVVETIQQMRTFMIDL